MKSIVIAALLSVLAGTACDRSESHAAGGATVSEKVEKAYRDALSTGEHKLGDLRKSFDEMVKEFDQKGDEAPAAWHQLKQALQSKFDRVNASLGDLKSASKETWADATTAFTHALDDLSKSLQDATKELKGG